MTADTKTKATQPRIYRATATNEGGIRVDLTMPNDHAYATDQPVEKNGTNEGPSPIDLMVASFCACKASVIRLLADRKNYPLESVKVDAQLRRVNASEVGDDGATGLVDLLECDIELTGNLTDEQRQRLYATSNACPVQRVFENRTIVKSNLID
jgi:putative redox protein